MSAYLRRFELHQFVETGTHLGDTLAYIARNNEVKCTSIELSDIFFQRAAQRFASYDNVELINGDSSKALPELVSKIKSPTLFWLDGHYSGGMTARSSIDTPVSSELEAILASPMANHVILIDDASLFNGSDSYPYLGTLLEMVRQSGVYDAEVSVDIIRLTPKALGHF